MSPMARKKAAKKQVKKKVVKKAVKKKAAKKGKHSREPSKKGKGGKVKKLIRMAKRALRLK